MENHSKLTGAFNLANVAAAIALARALNIGWDEIKRGIEKVAVVAGRMEYIQREPFAVIVDYAHTPDALHKVYESLKGKPLICVLGAAGGGRDKWKRPEFGKIASEFCSEVILTNEDPYDEDPQKILQEICRDGKKRFIIRKWKKFLISHSHSRIDRCFSWETRVSQRLRRK